MNYLGHLSMHENQHICTSARGDIDIINNGIPDPERSGSRSGSRSTSGIPTDVGPDAGINSKLSNQTVDITVPSLKKSRSRLRFPGIMPRRLKKKSLVFTTDPKFMIEFNTLFGPDTDDSYHYGQNIVNTIGRIGQHLGDEEVFSLLKFLLLEIENLSKFYLGTNKIADFCLPRKEIDKTANFDMGSDKGNVSHVFSESSANRTRQKDRSPYYHWVTFFYCLEYLPARFYNENVDITALILLKCYEFLTLRADDDVSLRSLQETLEHITNSVINKVSENHRENLASEILAGNLPCSSQHQYDAASLNHYLLHVKGS